MAEAIGDESGIDAGVGATPEKKATETETGIDQNVAGALAYSFGIVTGLVFYLVETENEFVRFHAAQSIAFSASVLALYVGLSVVGGVVSALTVSGSTGAFVVFGLVSLAWLAVTLGSFVLWVYLMVRAYQGEMPRVPVIAGSRTGSADRSPDAFSVALAVLRPSERAGPGVDDGAAGR